MSLLPEAITIDGHTVTGNAAVKFGGVDSQLDARFALHVPPQLRHLPPVPIYGRAPDAKPPVSKAPKP